MSKIRIFLTVCAAISFAPVPAMAYIGPGVGAGALAAVVGVVGSIFLALFAVLYYPVKRMIRKRKQKAASTPEGSVSEE